MPSAEDTHPAADDHLGVGGQAFGDIGVIEPDHPDVARLVADNGLGAASSPQPGFLSLPDVSHNGLLFALDKLGDVFALAVVEVAVGEEIEQVADGLDAQAVELSRHRRADPLEGGDGCLQRAADYLWRFC
ncbi:hypothetical protein ES708_19184 [subsurface metagenome]